MYQFFFVITDRIRRMGEDNVFTGVCLSVYSRGMDTQYLVSCPFPVSGPRFFRKVPQSLVQGSFSCLWLQVLSGGYPHLRCQVLSGYPSEGPGGRTEGTPLGLWTPQPGTVVPPSSNLGTLPVAVKAMDRTCNGRYASCIFKQKDFLVLQ